MMPLADMVALSTSVSNHWSSRSTALMVMSWTRLCWSRAGQGLEAPQHAAGVARRPRTSKEKGSGGTMDRIGLTKRAMSTMALAYSS